MRLLYVDTPFEGLQGGDKNRSRFIWSRLSEEFDADLLLIKSKAYATKPIEKHSGYKRQYSIGSTTTPHLKPQAIICFHNAQLNKFRDILIKEQYDIVVFRFLSTYHLACVASTVLPQCHIVIDVDMLFSRVATLAWHQNPTIGNRYNLFEMIKLKAFEAKAFKQNFSYYFTNSVERDIAVRDYDLDGNRAHVFPNMMPVENPPIYPDASVRYLLFFGTLNSIANQDAFRYLVTEIYPSIESQLRRAGMQIWVAGKNAPEYFLRYQDDCVRIVGEVDNMQELIAGSAFVILPLRIASGTRTRILEAAQMKKAVITTAIGLEGFVFGNRDILQKDTAADFATAILTLAEDTHSRDEYGKNLHHSARAKYGLKPIAEQFINSIKQTSKTNRGRRLKIALVSNRFFPEVGGAETNIYLQAKTIANHHEVTVFCPKRINRPCTEYVEGLRVIRMWDILNRPVQYPNLRSKTLCPTLFFRLLREQFDIVQCFPAINYNNILAFLAAKMKKLPYIICFFDFIDYAAYIKQYGEVPKDILNQLKLKWYQKIILQNTAKAFAISNKEIEYLRKIIPNVEFSPVPIDTTEFSMPTETPPLMRTWEQNHFVFLCLGRVSRIKGQDIALKAFCSIADQMPDAKLVFVGRSDYEAEFLEEMKKTLHETDLAEQVHFTGMVERKEALAWLRYSDIHVIPVRFMNSGAVVVESWISDTPVIQSDVVDPNLVVEGENGWLFASEIVSECAEKMLIAYQNKDLLPNLAAAGKARVLSTHTYDHLLDIYQKTYYDTLGKK